MHGKHGSQPTHTGRNISNRGRIGLAFPKETCFDEAPAGASRKFAEVGRHPSHK